MNISKLEFTIKDNNLSKNRIPRNFLSFSFFIVVIVFFLLSLPFGQLWNLRLGFIILNLSELARIAIGFLLVLYIGKFGVSKKFSFPLILTIILFIVYGFASIIFTGVSFSDVFRQSRNYAPFFIAVLILASKFSYDVEIFSRVIIGAALISSISALVLHFMFPQVIEDSFSAVNAEEVAEVAALGRMYWQNAFLVYFVIAIFFSSSQKTIFLWVVLISVTIALIATVSRTSLVLAAVFIFFLLVFNPTTTREKIKNLIFLILAFLAILMLMYYLFIYDNRLSELFDSRFLGKGNLASVYEEAILRNRMDYYNQYWEKIINYFPIGQGLGQPFAISMRGDYAYITDISLISFILPFGILGAVLFFVFIQNIFTLIRRAPNISYFLSRLRNALFIMVYIWIFISFNDDIFSRKDSVICLAIFSKLLFSHGSQRVIDVK